MASTFYVLRAVHIDPQIGKEYRTTDEVTRIQPGGYVYCHGRNLATWLRSWGYEVLVDPSGEYTNERGLSPTEAAELLNLPAGAVSALISAGRLVTHTWNKNGDVTLLSEQVQAQVQRQDQELDTSVDETGDVETNQVDEAETSLEEE